MSFVGQTLQSVREEKTISLNSRLSKLLDPPSRDKETNAPRPGATLIYLAWALVIFFGLSFLMPSLGDIALGVLLIPIFVVWLVIGIVQLVRGKSQSSSETKSPMGDGNPN